MDIDIGIAKLPDTAVRFRLPFQEQRIDSAQV